MKLQAMACPSCGATIDVKLEGRDFVFCPYCGQQIHIDNGRTEITINKNLNIHKIAYQTTRHEDAAEIIYECEKGKENKRTWILIVACALLGIGIPLGMMFKFDIEGKIAMRQGKVSVGFHKDLEGENYKSVVANLKAAGFNDIELIDLNDSGFFYWKDGDVEQVSIAGNTSFDSGDYFSTNTKVVISYH